MKIRSALARLIRKLADEPPRRNLARLRHRFKARFANHVAAENNVLGDILNSRALPLFLSHALRMLPRPLMIAGHGPIVNAVLDAALSQGADAAAQAFAWTDPHSFLEEIPGVSVIVCLLPVTEEEWKRATELKAKLGTRLIFLPELLLKYTPLPFLQRSLEYYIKTPAEILPFYLGLEFFGPLDALDKLFPIRGRSVIEFGPFDGCQTAGLVHLGAQRITCIEARAENAIKTKTAADMFGWEQVRIEMDDFHNADAIKHGRYDLAFAHGVYYHAIAPFVFLENLCSLADRIFLGGFCATDELPSSAWISMQHGGESYRVKQYVESKDYTAGVNSIAYFFEANDLMRFFSERGHRIEIISEENSLVTAGKFLRFLASTNPSQSNPKYEDQKPIMG